MNRIFRLIILIISIIWAISLEIIKISFQTGAGHIGPNLPSYAGPPPVHFLNHFEWIKSRGPSVPFVMQILFANTWLGRGAISFKHCGTSKMAKGQAPQNIFAMLWIWKTYMLDM